MSPDHHEHGPLTRNEITLIRELIKTTIDERDKRYEDRFKASETAVAAALQAQKEAVNAAFAASKEAIGKAEMAQTAYNERSNEFRQALDDQARLQLSRTEAEQQFRSGEQKIEDLKKRVGDLEKGEVGLKTQEVSKERSNANIVLYIGMAATLLIAFGSLLVSAILAIKKFWGP